MENTYPPKEFFDRKLKEAEGKLNFILSGNNHHIANMTVEAKLRVRERLEEDVKYFTWLIENYPLDIFQEIGK